VYGITRGEQVYLVASRSCSVSRSNNLICHKRQLASPQGCTPLPHAVARSAERAIVQNGVESTLPRLAVAIARQRRMGP